MGKIFLWFYCLPIPAAVLLVLLVTVGFLLLRKVLREHPAWKIGVALLLFAWIFVILYATLGQRRQGNNLSQPILPPFASYYTALHGGSREIYRTNFMNVVLFFPTGLLGVEALPQKWSKPARILLVTVLFALVSTGIEYAQYAFHLGMAEWDDIIHNTLGALVGAIAWGTATNLHK